MGLRQNQHYLCALGIVQCSQAVENEVDNNSSIIGFKASPIRERDDECDRRLSTAIFAPLRAVSKT